VATILKALQQLERDIHRLQNAEDPELTGLFRQALAAADAAYMLRTKEALGFEALHVAETVLGMEKYASAILDLK
jgi:hypothetical protein